jgi:hypothetical protein
VENDPARLFAAITPALTARKRRLFSVACCRAVHRDLVRLENYLDWAQYPGFPRIDAILSLAERFADGLCPITELNETYDRLADVEQMFRNGAQELSLFRGLLPKAELLTNTTNLEVRIPLPFVSGNVQCDMIRELFGNPFRAVTFSSEWRTDTALSLARQMYESREFSAMPILADALQDAGCNNEEVLSHCRDANQVHVRGCWVVDCVLGKE